MSSSYFQFYGLKECFFIDEKYLKQRYLKKSKENHPDFHLDDDVAYAKAMEATSTNNLAFKALKSFHKRTQYILESNDLLNNDKNALPPAFLMEMMDVNEELMSLQLEPDESKAQNLAQSIRQKAQEIETQLENAARKADERKADRGEILKTIKEIYLKRKYMLRLIESVDKFAPL